MTARAGNILQTSSLNFFFSERETNSCGKRYWARSCGSFKAMDIRLSPTDGQVQLTALGLSHLAPPLLYAPSGDVSAPAARLGRPMAKAFRVCLFPLRARSSSLGRGAARRDGGVSSRARRRETLADFSFCFGQSETDERLSTWG